MLSFAFLLVTAARWPETIHVNVDGVDREALVFPPTAPSPRPPLVFGFHGHSGNMRQAAFSFGLQRAWPQALVVYPQGLPTASFIDPAGKYNGWSPDRTERNRDLRFVDALFKKLQTTEPFDSRRVFAMGHSNGAQFMYFLWSFRGAKFAGFGSCEGSGGQSVALKPKPFFITIGDQDAIVPPQLQRNSLEAVFRVNRSSTQGTPYGDKGTLYPGDAPVVLWAYHGGHKFPEDCVPSMLRFFADLKPAN